MRLINADEILTLADYLSDHLGESLEKCGCNYALTRRWLAEHGLEVDASVNVILMLGGGCDCEIVYNCPQTSAELANKLLWALDFVSRNPHYVASVAPRA